MHPLDATTGPSSDARRFATTRWSVIVAAQEGNSPQAAEALADLCRTYWYPLYAFIRRQGHTAEDAQDLTQELFARLLERDFLANVAPEKGKFRAFLLAACKHFLADERDRARARKRGGGRRQLSFDLLDAEERYRHEPAHEVTAEQLFERQWALALLEQVLVRLREECVRTEKGPVFAGLKGFLTGHKDGTRYRQAAEELGLSEGAVKVAVHRLRKRYRELLYETIAETVDSPDRVAEEIRSLFAALGS